MATKGPRPLLRVRNSGERMSGRERTGAGFYPGGGGSAHLSAHRGALEGRPAPKIQAVSVDFFYPFWGGPEGAPRGSFRSSAHRGGFLPQGTRMADCVRARCNAQMGGTTWMRSEHGNSLHFISSAEQLPKKVDFLYTNIRQKAIFRDFFFKKNCSPKPRVGTTLGWGAGPPCRPADRRRPSYTKDWWEDNMGGVLSSGDIIGGVRGRQKFYRFRIFFQPI